MVMARPRCLAWDHERLPVAPPGKGGAMAPQTKPSIVFCHGIWADGSCFSKVIPPLQAEGYEVMAAQYGLDSNVEDVAATIRTLNRVHSPAILVGHSYGAPVITPPAPPAPAAPLSHLSPPRPADPA